MTVFSTTGTTTHSTLIGGLSGGNSYTYYIKCRDGQGNTDASDYSISFTIPVSVIAPTVTVQSPTSVGTSTITLNATIASDGNASSTQVMVHQLQLQEHMG